MHLIAELDRRLEETRRLLELEKEHLARVRDHGLDDADAQRLIELRRTYLTRLEEQRGLIVQRRLALHQAKAAADSGNDAPGTIIDEPPAPSHAIASDADAEDEAVSHSRPVVSLVRT